MGGLRLNKDAFKNLRNKLKTDNRFQKIFNVFVWSCVTFLVLGWNLSQSGPTLLDLQMVSNSTLAEASLLITAISCGFMISSFVIGITFDKFDKFLFIAIGNLGVAFVNAAIPWCKYYALMFTMHVLKGFTYGLVDGVTSTYLIHLFGQDCRSYIQILHLFYTFGGILSPLASAPFLTQQEMKYSSGNYNASNNTSGHMFLDYVNGSEQLFITETTVIQNTTYQQLTTDVYKAYSISSGLSFVSALPFVVMYFKYNKKLTVSNPDNCHVADEPDSLPKHLLIPVLVLISSVHFIYTAIEDSFAGFLATFLVKHFKWEKQLASYATSAYWGLFSIGSLIGIFIAPFFNLSKLLCVYSFMVLVSFTCLLLFSLYNISFGVWISVVMFGGSMSVFFPLCLAWTEEDFLHVSGRIIALFMMSGNCGVLVNPIILGQMMKQSPIWFCYILLGESVLMFSLFLIGTLLSKKARKFRKSSKLEITTNVNGVVSDDKEMNKQNSQIIEITKF